jgi:hypothetical protein
MNIFAVHENPGIAARSLPDKLVCKMSTESLQLLTPWAYNAHSYITTKPDGTQYSVKGYAHHPCMKWQYESPANVAWLLHHALVMCNEYTNRYGKLHGASHGLHQVLNLFIETYGDTACPEDHTPFVLAMPEQYKDPSNPVQSYRNYLLNEKGYAVWKHGNYPEWWCHETHKPARERYLADQQVKKVQRANAKHHGLQGSLQNV